MTISVKEFAELLLSTGHSHHHAYAVSDGADPEWALWYAPHLQTHLFDKLPELPTRSKLIYLLLAAEKEYPVSENPEWPPLYAKFMLDELT